MPALDHPLVGELIRWSHDGNVLVGLAGGYDRDRNSILLFADCLQEMSVLVPAAECRLADGGDGRTPGERAAYLRGLVDARGTVALIAAQLSMSGDVRRCSGVARAFEALDDLVQGEGEA